MQALPAGPIGDVWRFIGEPRGKANYAVVGLGTGTLAAYAQPGQKVTYYEIDPLVKRIAEDPKYFTFLQDCKKRGATTTTRANACSATWWNAKSRTRRASY